jgi:hypothetical protein
MSTYLKLLRAMTLVILDEYSHFSVWAYVFQRCVLNTLSVLPQDYKNFHNKELNTTVHAPSF